MPDAFADLFDPYRWRAGLAFLSLALIAGHYMNLGDKVMKAANGKGIVHYELARSRARADHILGGWGDEGRRAAQRSLLLDFPFLVGYGGTLAVACLSLAAGLDARGWGWAATAAQWGAVAAIVAALMDVLEDAALLTDLLGSSRGAVAPAIAWGAAEIKFTLVGLIVLAIPVATVIVNARPG